jgi:hypothetical protein
VTLQGSLVETTDQLARDRYLAKHPEALEYVEFPDFLFDVLVPVSAHLVAGFGAIHWLPWAAKSRSEQGAQQVSLPKGASFDGKSETPYRIWAIGDVARRRS